MMEKEWLANGNMVEVRHFDMDESCQKCHYTIFAAGKRYVEILSDGTERHYHYRCYTPLYARVFELLEVCDG